MRKQSRVIGIMLAVSYGIFGVWIAGGGTLRMDFTPSSAEKFSSNLSLQKKIDHFVSSQPVEGKTLSIYLDHNYARPGERWIEVECNIKPEKTLLEKTRVEAKIYGGLDYSELKDNLSIVPQRNRGRLEIDLRSLKLEQAKVQIRVLEDNQLTGFSEFVLIAQPCQTPFEVGKQVAVKIDTPAGLDKKAVYPLTFGVPFPAGAIWDADQVRLVDEKGKELPCQKEVTGRWAPEGAIQWLRFDALVTPKDGCFMEVVQPTPSRSRSVSGHPSKGGDFSERSPPRLGVASGGARAPEGCPTGGVSKFKLKLIEQDGKITIDTGVSTYILGKGISPIEEIWLNKKQVATSAGTRGMYLVDQKGRLASVVAEEEKMTIEASGPVASCVKFEGWYATADSKRFARHITRVECFAGEVAAQITHTLVLTEDTNQIWFKEVGWEFALLDKEAGQAIFGIDREDLGKRQEVKLEGSWKSSYMLQDSHYFFGHGTNHFLLAQSDTSDKSHILFEGAECGDYVVLEGKDSGLSLICRDTARQHPKEFEVSAGRINLKLFSSRAGEELDFRTKTLLQKWDVMNWRKHVLGDMKDPEKELKDNVSNASGWSKTHLLKILPIAGDNGLNTVMCETLKLKHPVYGFVDPQWLYASRAMGPLYPQDKQRFPETEEMVEAYFRKLLEADTNWGENGFIDYAAGPEFNYKAGYIWPEMRRNGLTYLLRPGLWQLYARSGDRAIREFIEASNRTWMDSRHGHWNTSSGCRKGMLRWVEEGLPFYWAPNAEMEYGNTSSLNHLIWQYYLTGYRRAGDVVRDFSAGIKELWSPQASLRITYPPNILWHLAQCYGFTHDRQIHDLADAMMDLLEDPEGTLGFNKHANAQSTTYKCAYLVRSFISAWELIGETRFHQVAQAYADYIIRSENNIKPFGTTGYGFAVAGSFRYDETRDPVLAENMLCQVRWHNSVYLPEKADFIQKGFYEAPFSTFLTDIGYALHVIVQSDVDKKPLVSWLAYEDTGKPSAIFLQKPEDGKVKIYYHAPGVVEGVENNQPFSVGKADNSYNVALFNMTVEPGNVGAIGSITFPKDMGGYTYRLAFTGSGEHWFFADCRVPFVFYAPGYWRPIPNQRPAVKYFFQVQPDNQEAQIFFEGTARLFDPSGKPYPNNELAHGWIALPKEKAGLWAFEPIEQKVVKTRNVPPFFAVRDPANYFLPEVAWEREAKPAPLEIPTNTPFGPGAIDKPGNQALYLTGGRTFQILPGLDREDGDGSAFLPMREGTIEFFMKPLWNSAELPDQDKRFLFAPLKVESNFTGSDKMLVDYFLGGNDKNLDKALRFTFNTSFTNSDFKQGTTKVFAFRPSTFFEKEQWVHIACVWGQRNNIETVPGDSHFRDHVVTGEIYVNGRLGARPNWGKRNSGQNSCLVGPMRYLQIGLQHAGLANLDIAIDELRISDVQRYKNDFKPPSRDEEFKVDEHTRALFHFNGNLEGECWGAGDKPKGKIEK
jgi:hypothetical protein